MPIPVEELVEKYKPVFYIHNQEKVSPSSITNILQNCELYDGNNRISAFNTLDENNIPEGNENFRLAWNGAYSAPSNPVNAPVYVTYGDYDLSRYYIRYTTIYPYQGPYTIFWKDYGAHIFDLESFTIYVDKETGAYNTSYLSAHGSHQGMWAGPQHMRFEGTRPVIYIAKIGHGLYNEPKRYYRLFYTCSDDCNRNTIRWDPTTVFITPNSPIVKYNGKWPDGNIKRMNSTLSGENPPYNATDFTRTWAFWEW